jgi:hypothetical protein
MATSPVNARFEVVAFDVITFVKFAVVAVRDARVKLFVVIDDPKMV